MAILATFVNNFNRPDGTVRDVWSLSGPTDEINNALENKNSSFTRKKSNDGKSLITRCITGSALLDDMGVVVMKMCVVHPQRNKNILLAEFSEAHARSAFYYMSQQQVAGIAVQKLGTGWKIALALAGQQCDRPVITEVITVFSFAGQVGQIQIITNAAIVMHQLLKAHLFGPGRKFREALAQWIIQ